MLPAKDAKERKAREGFFPVKIGNHRIEKNG